jgi:hypothetical protein
VTVVFINGSFGVGKTSAANALKRVLRRGVTYNPEMFPGGHLWKLPRWIALENRDSGDYQDMPLWRNTAVRSLRMMRRLNNLVLVPMAFSNLSYLCEIMAKTRAFDPDVRHFCLVAPFELVKARLRKRGDAPFHLSWQLRRAKDCCIAHADPAFALRIDASERSPESIAQEIADSLDAPAVPPAIEFQQPATLRRP